MNTFHHPYIFLESEIALYHAHEDGTPLRDPLTQEIAAPVAKCLASGEVTASHTAGVAGSGDWRGIAPPTQHAEWNATVTYTTGAWREDGTPVSSSLSPDANYILVIRTHDEAMGNWELVQLHYARVTSHSTKGDTRSSADSFSLTAGHKEVFSGNTATDELPPLLPRVVATVEWEQAGRTIPCFYYDPATETWSESPLNRFTPPGGSPVRYCYVGPDADDGTQAIIQYLAAYTTTQTPEGNQLPRTGITHSTVTAAIIGNHLNAVHHGLRTSGRHSLQTLGCAEPVAAHPSSAHWQHPLIRFRHLRRVYCTITHGVIAIPSVQTATADTIPPLDPPIIIAPAGDPNPQTGHTGITLLPHTAILDGTILPPTP